MINEISFKGCNLSEFKDKFLNLFPKAKLSIFVYSDPNFIENARYDCRYRSLDVAKPYISYYDVFDGSKSACALLIETTDNCFMIMEDSCTVRNYDNPLTQDYLNFIVDYFKLTNIKKPTRFPKIEAYKSKMEYFNCMLALLASDLGLFCDENGFKTPYYMEFKTVQTWAQPPINQKCCKIVTDDYSLFNDIYAVVFAIDGVRFYANHEGVQFLYPQETHEPKFVKLKDKLNEFFSS